MELIRVNIYKSDRITAPAVYGIIRPKIIIPAEIADGDIDYIILHEQVHIARRDNLFRVVALITACVHWFNPLSWIFLKYFFADMELACDAKVLKSLDECQTKEYALTILTCASGKTFFANLSFPDSPTTIESLEYLLQSPQWATGTAISAFNKSGEIVGSIMVYGTIGWKWALAKEWLKLYDERGANS